jgi:hypothetical protein
MHDSITWIGMDVHKENILAAAVNGTGETISRCETPNTVVGKEMRALSEKPGEPSALACC